MKFVFAYDVRIEQVRGTEQLYHNYFDYTVWARYLEVCEKLAIVTRVVEVGENEPRLNRKLSSGPNVSFHGVPSISNPVSQLTKRKEVTRIIEEQLKDADGLIARLPSEIGTVAIAVAKRLGKPWAVEVVGHAWDALMNHGSWQGKCYAPIMTWRTKNAVRQAPYALYVTRAFLQHHYPSWGYHINCSNVEVPPVPQQVLDHRLKRVDEQTDGWQTVGIVGSLASNNKGVDTAIEALSMLKGQMLRLRVLGEGDKGKWVELAARWGVADRVEFCDPVPSGEEVFRWLDELDFYMQPSFQEGLPRALIEAMSRALPAIGSTAGGIPELLPEEWIFRAGDAAGLAEKMQVMISNRDMKRNAAATNFTTAQQYTKDVLDKRRTAFWQSFKEEAVRQSILSNSGMVKG
ncbi:glycosyltransferase family 4 protein [Paenibacillus sp. SC116]|uniref:glycosyltransferase n=1 Tax=Paenibacillus sp. SC116 TaxID=2968986 RepID=UPI00215A5CD5|nr:glycosyltransferase family 4 protein [Paenibacillus sp. SC116]MCR8844172.1 glycosyltransferase family 4 protein [Paenibacillus sp. SC116]